MRKAAVSLFLAMAMLLAPAMGGVSEDGRPLGAMMESRGLVNNTDSEPNNDLTSATNITGNFTIPGSIALGDPNDFYRVHLNNTTSPNRLNASLNFTSNNPTATAYLTILDPDGFRLGEVLCDGTKVNSSAVAVLQGWYYIGILWNIQNQGSATIDYTLNISLVDIVFTPDGNDDLTSSVGVVNEDFMSDSLDELVDVADYYKIHLEAEGGHVDVVLMLIEPGVALDLVIEIYTGGGDHIRSVDDAEAGGDEMAYFVSPATDDYYFRLWAHTGTGDYNLSIRAGTGWTDNDNDLDNATLVERGVDIEGNTTDDLDPDDFFKINLTLGEEITVNLTVLDFNATLAMPLLNLWLYNATSFVKNSTSIVGAHKGIWYEASSPGWYFIRVGASDMSFGAYEVLVTIESPPTILPHGSIVEIDEDLNGTLDLLTMFEDPQGGDLAFGVEGNISTSIVIVDNLANISSVDENWYGSEVVTFTATNDKGKTASVELTVTFLPINDAPVAREDELIILMDEDDEYPITYSFLGTKFSDVDGDDLEFTILEDDNVTTVPTNSSFIITPAANWNGHVLLKLIAEDPSGLNATLTINLTVLEIEDDPVSTNVGIINLTEDGSTTLDLAAYFSDPDMGVLKFDGYSEGDLDGERHVFVTMNGTIATVTLTPDWYGEEQVTFTVTDVANNTATSSAMVKASPVNDAPVVNQVYWNQYATESWVVEDHTGSFDLSNLFTDVDGDGLEFTVHSSGDHITAQISSVNLIVSPDTNWYGMETVNISAKDPSDLQVWTDLPITVINENDRPSLSNGDMSPKSGDAETKFKFSVLVTDIDGDEPIVTVVVDGDEYRMAKVSGDVTTGAQYSFEKKLGGGKHTYSFKADDNQHTATSTTDLPGGNIEIAEPMDTTTILYLVLVIIVIIVLIVLLVAAMRRAQRMKEFDDTWDDDEEEEDEGIPDDDDVEEE